LYAALYGPTANELHRSLLDMADGLHAQLIALHDHPTVHACNSVAANQGGAARAVLRLGEALQREGGNDG
jgi:hypothetical protein